MRAVLRKAGCSTMLRTRSPYMYTSRSSRRLSRNSLPVIGATARALLALFEAVAVDVTGDGSISFPSWRRSAALPVSGPQPSCLDLPFHPKPQAGGGHVHGVVRPPLDGELKRCAVPSMRRVADLP